MGEEVMHVGLGDFCGLSCRRVPEPDDSVHGMVAWPNEVHHPADSGQCLCPCCPCGLCPLFCRRPGEERVKGKLVGVPAWHHGQSALPLSQIRSRCGERRAAGSCPVPLPGAGRSLSWEV